MEAWEIPNVDFKMRENGEWRTRNSDEFFNGKKVILFSLPGAFTPTCSEFQLPGYEANYEKFKEAGIDEIYCISVNDAFVMNAWAKDQNIEKVKMLPDGSGKFTRGMGMLVEKNNLGFGLRSWRYVALINNNAITTLWIEEGIEDNKEEDPYEISTPENILNWFKQQKISTEV